MDDRLAGIISEHGVFLRREALGLGYDDRTIRRAIRSGVWHRVRHGAYVFTDQWRALSPEEKHVTTARAVIRTSKTDLVLSHVTAAVVYGARLWRVDLSVVHVTRTDGRAGRAEAGVTQHAGALMQSDYGERDSLRLTTPARTAIDLATLLDTETSLCAIDGLLHEGLCTTEELAHHSERMRQWPRSLKLTVLLRLVDGRSESVGETRARHLCWTQGLPMPEPQHPIVDGRGVVVAEVDLAWPEYGVYLEFDGAIKYDTPFAADAKPSDVVTAQERRQELIWRLTGWRCIRITWDDLRRPVETARRIRLVLNAAS